jgi:hypothetical protein
MDIATGLAAASAALSTVKQLAELDKALSQAELKMKMASLYSDLADVRMALTDAKAVIADLQGWAVDAADYRLTEIGGSAFVYARSQPSDTVPAHWLCTTCFDRKIKSYLQSKGNVGPRGERMEKATWACGTCRNEIRVFYSKKPTYEAS